ncbi:MAG: NYN domain-containing protein [Bacillota bacterium]
MYLQTAIFIDSGYLDKVLEKEHHTVRIDFSKLIPHLATDVRLLRTYYYFCYPYKSTPPLEDELKRIEGKQAFINQIAVLDDFALREGRLEHRGEDAQTGKPIYVQKRIDVKMAVDLTLLATKNKITHAVIIAGDSDFIPAIEVAKNEGVHVTLVHGEKNKAHNDLIEICDKRIVIDAKFISEVGYRTAASRRRRSSKKTKVKPAAVQSVE